MAAPLYFGTFACAALCATSVLAADWTPVRRAATVNLLVDKASVSRMGDDVSLRYLIDYASPRDDMRLVVNYRSIVVNATLRCSTRKVSLGMSELYSGPSATGERVATSAPTPVERAFAPLEKGSSDEDLWRRFCPRATKPGG
jgi:hypothetical protein